MRLVFSPTPSLSRETEGGWRWWSNVWVPVAIALIVIAIESTRTFSAQNTSSWLRPIIERLIGPVGENSWQLFHHYLRKTGHFVGYGAVDFTFLRAWLHTRARAGIGSLRAWRLECTVLAILSTAVVAGCDEFHQSMLPGRTGTPLDVLLDSCGACTCCIVIWLLCWRGRGASRHPPQT